MRERKRFLALLLSAALVVTMDIPSFAAGTLEVQSNPESIQEEVVEETTQEISEDEVSEETVLVEEVSENETSKDEISGNTVSVDEVSENAVGEASIDIEINQGLSNRINLQPDLAMDAGLSKMNDFVAKKSTAVMFVVPNSENNGETVSEDAAREIIKNYKLSVKAVNNGTEAENEELSAVADNISLKRYYTQDGSDAAGWMAVMNFPTGPDKGNYNFHLFDGENEVGTNNGVNFYETKTLNILAAPVTGYWGGAYQGGAPSAGSHACTNEYWNGITEKLKTYLKDVYPIADINIVEGKTIDASSADYDMCTSDGQKKLWEEANKLQTKNKETGKDEYDLILAFVMYRQDQGGGQGYTFGRPTNIITLTDKDMLPTVAHEIAHCYQIGDEYDGGSINNSINYMPVGFKGRDFVSGQENTGSLATGDFWKAGSAQVNETNGSGTVVYPSFHPYKLSSSEFVHFNEEEGKKLPTISYMGSGYAGSDNYYWTTSLIWEHLFKELTVKEKKEENQEQSTGNAEIAVGASSDSIFDPDDFYYGDDCRWGESRMVEVTGYIDRNPDGSVSVDMMPMFSYDGDLEYIYDNDETVGNTDYTFAALDEKGNIMKSPVDEELSVYSFKESWYNAATQKDQSFVSFRFDAEYPEGTASVALYAGLPTNGSFGNTKPLWSQEVTEDAPVGSFTQINVNNKTAEVEWQFKDVDLKDKESVSDNIYTEVYYAPQGDEGKVWYVASSDDDDWEWNVDSKGKVTGSIAIDTSNTDEGYGWSDKAYVWVAVTDGINTLDLYSDEAVSSTKASLNDADVIVKGGKNGEFTYTGSEITPVVKVNTFDGITGQSVALKQDVDYAVTCSDNVDVGEAVISLRGIGEYAGEKAEAKFTIVSRSFADKSIKLDSLPDIACSSNEAMQKTVEDELTVWDGNHVVSKENYTISYNGASTLNVPDKTEWKDETYPVEVSIQATLSGNYVDASTKKTSFEVVDGTKCKDISTWKINLPAKSGGYQYTGKPIKATITSITFGDEKLTKKDYKVIYTNNINAGKAVVRVIGKGDFYGVAKTEFTIEKRQIAALKVSAAKKVFYTGLAYKDENFPVTVKAGSFRLKEGIDYAIAFNGSGDYTGATKKGAAKPEYTVTLLNNSPNFVWSSKAKATSFTGKFTIAKAQINKSSSTSIAVTSINGIQATAIFKQKTLKDNILRAILGSYKVVSDQSITQEGNYGITVSNHGTKLTEGTDYTVTIKTTKPGKSGIITIKAKGDNCTGTRKIKFFVEKPAVQ